MGAMIIALLGNTSSVYFPLQVFGRESENATC